MVWSLCVSLHGSLDYAQTGKIYHTDHMQKVFPQCVAACVLLDRLDLCILHHIGYIHTKVWTLSAAYCVPSGAAL